MKNIYVLLLLPLLFLSCASNDQGQSRSQDEDHDVNERLAELGIEFTEGAPPTANYLKATVKDDLVFLSGHGPETPEGGLVIGRLGSDLVLEEGQEAARLVGIALLNSLQNEIGDLNKVKRILKVTGMVNADPSFTQHSQVINGFSDLMVDVFGEKGRHARSSVGMSSLPSNIAVEIEMIVEFEN